MDKNQGSQQSQTEKRKEQDRSGTSKQHGGRTDKSSQQNRDRQDQQGSDRSSSSVYKSPEAEADE